MNCFDVTKSVFSVILLQPTGSALPLHFDIVKLVTDRSGLRLFIGGAFYILLERFCVVDFLKKSLSLVRLDFDAETSLTAGSF